MKVIFLDIDGVLNTDKDIRKFGINYIDENLVAIIYKIIKETNAKIILSSTWRIKKEDKKIVNSYLSKYNLKIHDCTPIIEDKIKFIERKEEIKLWLDNNKVDKFAIIDDWDDANIGHSFFLINNSTGITLEISEKIINHLNFA